MDYSKTIKPLLHDRCYACHGALKQKGKLRLDTVELMLNGEQSGAVSERGKPEKSLLVERVINPDIAERMPPEHEGEPLTAEQVALLRGFSVWMAGGGLKRGVVHGATDEIGFHATENRHYVTDIHATILHQPGLDSRKLEIPGRKRLEIDRGNPIEEIIA